MSKRRGELSPAGIDRDWPHQVALPIDSVKGTQYDVVHDFCRGLSLCPRGHSVRRGDVEYRVFCFSELAHANLFRAVQGRTIQPGRSWPWNRMVRVARPIATLTQTERHLRPQFDTPLRIDLTQLRNNYNVYLKLMIDGQPTRPFSAITLKPRK